MIEKGQDAEIKQSDEIIALEKTKVDAWANKTNAEACEIRGRNYISWALLSAGFVLSLSAIPWPHMIGMVGIAGPITMISGAINIALGGNVLQKFKQPKE